MAKETFLMADVNAQAQANRDYEYTKVIHPMLVKVQLGQMTQKQLQDAVNEIDAKYPFVTEDLVVDVLPVASLEINRVP